MDPRDIELLEKLRAAIDSEQVTETQLHTDDRVLARISDGIYRRPSSALRELVANAWDADATEVVIQTDAPRFREISVRDNGNGMGHEALVRLINHIGGSSKRTLYGADLKVTSKTDPSLSPGGRKLIGKIGIGLFSVAQLTRSFTIITKQAGEPFRIVAKVNLRTYSEDDLATKPDGSVVTTGSVAISTVRADDRAWHGTEVLLYDLQPAARDMLRSYPQWSLADAIGDSDATQVEELRGVQKPVYHVGWLRSPSDDEFAESPHLPWKESDAPDAKFQNLYDAVVGELQKKTSRPKLSELFDEYLRTLWTISLSLPLEYLDGVHPFDLGAEDEPRFFQFSNKARGGATEISLGAGETLRSKCGFSAPFVGRGGGFAVLFDGVALRRPLRFNRLPKVDLKDDRSRPLLFVGKYRAPLEGIEIEVSGGRELEFEGYLLWSKKIVPTEHKGILIRIADASGTLFDESFLGYQVQELNRLAQVSGEIFVRKGLDAALNIDRESFNFGHPHAKIVAGWVHRALRQLATAQKKLAKEVRDRERGMLAEEQLASFQGKVRRRLLSLSDQEPPSVKIVEAQLELGEARRDAEIAISRSDTLRHLPHLSGNAQRERRELVVGRVAAIAQLLEAFGLLSLLDYERQQELFAAIAEVVGDVDG